MNKLLLFIMLSLFGNAMAQKKPIAPKVDSLSQMAEPIDTVSYAEEFRRDVWKHSFGLRGGLSKGKFNIKEALIDKVSPSGLPIFDGTGQIEKANFVNNPSWGTGFDAGFFMRFTRGSFFIQPELVYSAKAGKFDLLKNDGSLSKRVSAQINSIDIPVLIGVRFKNARVFFGPSTNFAFAMNSSMKNALSDFTQSQNLGHLFFSRPNLNFNVGLAFELKHLFIDVRYEKGMNTYTLMEIGPDNAPVGFRIFADGVHVSIGLANK
jgi:Outer membrane protein beta-barrel domain